LIARQFFHAFILADECFPDNRTVPLKDVVALLLGLGIAIVVAVLATGIRDSSDPSMRWEGGVAVGFTAVIVLGPFWIAQAVLTVLATFDDAGMAPGWLWGWLFLAPAVGASPPATGVVALLKRSRRSHEPPVEEDRQPQ
jgi:MFS family permease